MEKEYKKAWASQAGLKKKRNIMTITTTLFSLICGEIKG
jgi:hypothetical protein